jgi:hypothetical protein
MPGVTNVRLVPTANGADHSRWMPGSKLVLDGDPKRTSFELQLNSEMATWLVGEHEPWTVLSMKSEQSG